MRQFINNSHDVPQVKSPISQAVVVGKHCYISGQLSTDWAGHYLAGSVVEEAKRAFDNVFAIAQAAGFSKAELVFMDIAFLDLNDVDLINDLFAQLFDANQYPARTIYQAAALPYGGKVKVTAIGLKD